MRCKRIHMFVLLASFVCLLLLVGISACLESTSPEGLVVAHHMAPNTNSVDIGNLNEEMVHHGFYLGVMPAAPEIGGGNLNRQLWENPPQIP